MIGGNITVAALGLSDVVAALRDDRLVGLGIAARHRSGILPDMPVLGEAGVPLDAWIHRGVAVPADCPGQVTDAMISALRSVTEDVAFRKQAESQGLLGDWSDGADWRALMERESVELAALWASDPWLNAAGQ